MFNFLFKFNINGFFIEYNKRIDKTNYYTSCKINYIETINTKLPITSIFVPAYTIDIPNSSISITILDENANVQILEYKFKNMELHYFLNEVSKTYVYKQSYFKDWELNHPFKINFDKLVIEKNV